MIYQGKAITVKPLEGGIVELNFDLKGESVNKFNRLTLSELRAAVDAIKADASVKGVIVTSGKDVFIVGADITEFVDNFQLPDEELMAGNLEANKIFSDFEDLDVPTVAAINGIALGGGLEMCLAADFRVMSATAKVGLPEVKLGIYPGFGGTVRLPRLIGCDNAVEWIASGKENKAEDALKVGAVDAVVAPEQLQAAALDLAKRAVAGELDHKARRQPKLEKLKLNAIEQMMAFETAKGFVAGQAGPNYPAPVEAIKSIQKAANFGRDKALEVEAAGFVKLAKTSVAQSLIGLFLNDQELKKKAKKYDEVAKDVKLAAVLGAGIMGGGIAYQSALKGTPILMKDIREEGIQMGLNEAAKLLGKRVREGSPDPGEDGRGAQWHPSGHVLWRLRQRRHRRRSRRREPQGQASRARRSGRRGEGRRDHRLQHLDHLHQPAGPGAEASGKLLRHAFLQPGAHDAAGGSDPWREDR